MATKKIDSNDLLRQTFNKVCAIERRLEALEAQMKPIYLATAGPDEPLSIILAEDVLDLMPGFDEYDRFYNLPDSAVTMSYCPAEVIHLPGKDYLTGRVVFFRMDDDFEIVSLRLEDICQIAAFLSEHDTALMADGVSFNGICLD